jgi:HD-GYP domain-containing protein (c-di-GMP phosphodiesterase class II)
MRGSTRSRLVWLRRTVAVAAKLIFFGLALGAVTVVFGGLTAAVVGCFILWAALLQTLRSLRREKDAVEVKIEAVRQQYNSIIEGLTSAMGLQDDLKASHGRRVSDLAFILAQQLGIYREESQLIQRAAVLADIGKMDVAESILSKPGELNDQEWMEMQRHPEFGHRILLEVLHLSDAAEIVLAHHERFDGQGYPNGLKGEEIPMGSRIYAVADAYVAMTSDRPHRKKMTHEAALREILRNSLTQFDPEVVRGFVQAEELGLIGGFEAPVDGTGRFGPPVESKAS